MSKSQKKRKAYNYQIWEKVYCKLLTNSKYDKKYEGPYYIYDIQNNGNTAVLRKPRKESIKVNIKSILPIRP